MIYSVIFCEAVAIYGVIIAIILSQKVTSAEIKPKDCAKAFFSGYSIFWSGISVGFTNLLSGIAVGVSGKVESPKFNFVFPLLFWH